MRRLITTGRYFGKCFESEEIRTCENNLNIAVLSDRPTVKLSRMETLITRGQEAISGQFQTIILSRFRYIRIGFNFD